MADNTIPSQKAVSNPVTTQQPTVNPQGLTVQQMGQAASTSTPSQIVASKANPGLIVNGPVTGTTAGGQGIAPVQTQAQAYTTTPVVQPSGAVSPNTQSAKDLSQMQKTQADITANNNLIAQEKQTAIAGGYDPTTGSAVTSRFNPATGQWERTQAGAAMANAVIPPAQITMPTVNSSPSITPDVLSTINSAMTPNGVFTTDAMDAANQVVGDAIANAKATSLQSVDTNPLDAVAANLANTYNQQAQQYLQYAQDSTTDPMAIALQKQNALIAQEKSAAVTDIQTQADQQYNAAVKNNAEAVGQMKVAQASGGVAGSPLGVSLMMGVYQNNQAALQQIKDSENKALTDAQTAYDKQEIDVAIQQAQLADQRKQQYTDLLGQSYSVLQNAQQADQQRQQLALQTQAQTMSMKQQGMQMASDYLGVFAKQKLDPSVIPESVWQQASVDSGGAVSTTMAKAMYMGSLKDQQASDIASFNQNTAAFYQTAAQISDPNATLYRPNPDGTFTAIKKSAVQAVPNYDTFQTTKNGKNYATYVNKADPTAPPVEVQLGDVQKSTSMTQDAMGNTIVITDNGDGTFSSKKILDFAGNPVGQQAVVTTVSNLDSSGSTYSQNTGTPSWAPPNGSEHIRGGKPATECGQFVNDMLGTHMPDSLQGKIAQCDTSIGTSQNPVQMGDAVVTNEAAGTGHVAIVSSIGQDAKGTYYVLTESNYKKNAQGQGLVETGRKIYANSGMIQGFARGSKNPADQQTDGPQSPKDNSMSWTVNAPSGSPVSTAIQNGTVQSISQVGEYKDGSPMYMASIKDNDTGTITNYSGINSSELRVGSSWSNTQSAPNVGTSGNGGYGVDLRNSNGSPIAPTGHSLSAEVTAGQTWGKLDINSLPGKFFQNKYKEDVTALAKGTKTLDTVLSDWKNDPNLGQVDVNSYFADFQDASVQGADYNLNKETQTKSLQQRIATQKAMEANRILQAIPDYEAQKTNGVIAKAVVAENSQRDIQAAMQNGDDAMLLDAATRYQNAGGAITEGQLSLIKDVSNVWDQAAVAAAKASGKRVFMSDGQRQQIVGAITDSINSTMQQYQTYTSSLQDALKANGSDFQIPQSPLALQVQTGQNQTQQGTPDLSYYQSQLQSGETLMQDAQGNYVAVSAGDDTTGLTPAQ